MMNFDIEKDLETTEKIKSKIRQTMEEQCKYEQEFIYKKMLNYIEKTGVYVTIIEENDKLDVKFLTPKELKEKGLPIKHQWVIQK